nr:hypothetical protein [uncultured Allomuricauda sp.]
MEPIIIDKDVFRKMKAEMRQDLRIGVVGKDATKFILGLAEKDFYNEKNSPESKLIASKKKGKFIWSSVVKEFERIHGTPYKDAII